MMWNSVIVFGNIITLVTMVYAQGVFQSADCRLCSEGCQTVPRSDGSCPVCICNEVALPDCPGIERECPRTCTIQREADGCRQCSCRRQDRPVICPALPPCPEECQQLMNVNGCPECICDTSPRDCPAIDCPEQCTERRGLDGCLSCFCQRAGICPSVRPCLRGCVEMDAQSGCFGCNCSLPSDDPFSIDIFRPSRLPVPRCRSLRLSCPPGCRVAIAAHGCRECFCGDDAYLCPGVPECPSSCLVRSPEDRCCRCNCSESSPGVFRVSVIRIPPFGPVRPIRGFNPFRPFGRIPPSRRFAGDPSFSSLFTRLSAKNCSASDITCKLDCRTILNSDGCPVCECPGDLCPRIRCPQRCITTLGINGCPECDCGGRPEPVNPDTIPSDDSTPELLSNADGPRIQVSDAEALDSVGATEPIK